jgi:hypothetical protein
MADNAAEAVAAVQGYEPVEPRGVRERYTGWASGAPDEGMAFIVAGASNGSSDPVAYPLFDLHVMEFDACGYPTKVRTVKEWGYAEAARYVTSRRHQGRVRGYRLDWGRQAARDGLCLALWGHLRGCGLAARAEQFGIGERGYQRVRDHVEQAAKQLLTEFETLLGAANAIDLAGYR